jgi:hypothetical protein
MNINTIRDNLKNTIKGKEAYLEEVRKAREQLASVEGAGAAGQDSALFATQEFLKININELKVILFDVEKCCEKNACDSWRDNPDRSGGQFTQDEIDNATRWN